MRELGTLSLLDALACLELLHELGSAKLERAPVLGWHGRLATESSVLTLGESQLALAAISRACGPANATRSRSCAASSGVRSQRSCRLSRKPTLQSWVARPMTFGDLETGRELSCRADRGWWRPTLRDALGNSVLSPATLRGADSLCRWSSG